MPPERPMTDGSGARGRLRERLFAHGSVAVLRLPRADDALRAIEAVHAGGVLAIEITITTPGAFAIIAETATRLPDVLVGAGSVLDVAAARRAVDAGAMFLVSPVFKSEIVDEAHRLNVPVGPGAFTPSEILRAHEAGADVVKIFPADTLGIAFLKGVLAPMPFLRLMPTGGVTPQNAGDWLRAGAACVGLGGALIDPALVAGRDFAALTARAQRLTQSVAEARASSGTAP